MTWSVVIFYYSPTGIVDKLGIENSYLLLALLAMLGGSSIFLPFPYYLFTITFGAAGLNPVLLGLAAGLGTLIGDTTSYLAGYYGHRIVPKQATHYFVKVHDWAMHRNPAVLPLLAFIYSISPFPDDVIMIPAGLTRYPFWRLALGVGPGKVVFNVILALAGLYGWNLFA